MLAARFRCSIVALLAVLALQQPVAHALDKGQRSAHKPQRTRNARLYRHWGFEEELRVEGEGTPIVRVVRRKVSSADTTQPR